jgi:tetratricopeptide (TPR) repeat protein
VALQHASLRLAPLEQDPVGYAESLQCLGSVALAEGEPARASALFEESLGLFDRAGTTAARARYQFNLGLAALLQGDGARAATLLEDAAARSAAWGNLWPLAAARAGLAILAVRRGDWATATSLLRACLATGRQLDNHWGVAHVQEVLAWAAAAQGRLERAAGLFGLADAGLARIGASLWAPFQALHEQHLTTARAGLGAAVFEAAWRVGRTLPPEPAAIEDLVIEDGPSRPDLAPGENELAGLVARVGHE